MTDDPSPYAYTDYRAWLKDWFAVRSGRPSQSAFAKRVPCSPALLSSILNDTRNMGRARAERVANVLKLDDDARAYFLDLVTFSEGASPADRDRAWRRIQARRQWSETDELDETAYVVFTNWLYPALFEMMRWPDFRADPHWLAERVRPRVSPEDIAEALAFMESHGLCGPGAETRFEEVARVLSSGHHIDDRFRGHLVGSYHVATLDLLKQRLFETQSQARQYTTMTFAADANVVEEVKRQMRSVIELASASSMACTSPDRVMVLGIQLAPVAGNPDESELDPAPPTRSE